MQKYELNNFYRQLKQILHKHKKDLLEKLFLSVHIFEENL